MANKNKIRWAGFILLILLVLGLALWRIGTQQRARLDGPSVMPTPFEEPAVVSPTSPPPPATPTPVPISTPVKKTVRTSPPVPVAPETPPPPITLHKELIPKNIEIIRVYYAQELTGPGSIVEFDINGSGFNEEFEKMITAESGSPFVAIRNLKLITPNQIHGVLVIKADAPTGAIFPRILIQGKVVFRAPDPFAVIRPGEVLNLIFMEMGESGRSGRFRVFTNLTEEMYSHFLITSNTESIKISNLTPQLPFIVDGTIQIGSAPEGSYDITIKLANYVIWDRPGMIRVIQPNVGQSGLVQQLRAADGFHRPGDQAKFLVQGSGFQPGDADILTVQVDGFSVITSSMVVRSPGRMEITLTIPMDAKEGAYPFRIFHGSSTLVSQDQALAVVGKNWTRALRVEPELKSGQTGRLKLIGRDLEKRFVENIHVELDTEQLEVGRFTWVSPELATATISATPALLPGDYWVKMSSDGTPVTPHFGSIIRVGRN